MSHVTHELAMSHIHESFHLSCHVHTIQVTHEGVMSHISDM